MKRDEIAKAKHVPIWHRTRTSYRSTLFMFSWGWVFERFAVLAESLRTVDKQENYWME